MYFRVCYDRSHSVFVTNMLSALWHGFYPGYYLAFFMVALGSIIGRKVRTFTCTCIQYIM